MKSVISAESSVASVEAVLEEVSSVAVLSSAVDSAEEPPQPASRTADRHSMHATPMIASSFFFMFPPVFRAKPCPVLFRHVSWLSALLLY